MTSEADTPSDRELPKRRSTYTAPENQIPANSEYQEVAAEYYAVDRKPAVSSADPAPTRKSLPEAELIDLLSSKSESDGTLSAITFLEEQLELRAQDTAAYQLWSDKQTGHDAVPAETKPPSCETDIPNIDAETNEAETNEAETNEPETIETETNQSDTGNQELKPKDIVENTVDPYDTEQDLDETIAIPRDFLAQEISTERPKRTSYNPALDSDDPAENTEISQSSQPEPESQKDLFDEFYSVLTGVSNQPKSDAPAPGTDPITEILSPTSSDLEPESEPVDGLGDLIVAEPGSNPEPEALSIADAIDLDSSALKENILKNQPELVAPEPLTKSSVEAITEVALRLSAEQPRLDDDSVSAENDQEVISNFVADSTSETAATDQIDIQALDVAENDQAEAAAVPAAAKPKKPKVSKQLVREKIARASGSYWLWFAVTGALISIVVAAIIMTQNISLRQGIISVLLGIGVSVIPLGATALARRQSGHSAVVVSRAVFGHLGNVIPILVTFISRVFWSAVLIWLGSRTLTALLEYLAVDTKFGILAEQLFLISAIAVFILLLGLLTITHRIIEHFVRVVIALSIVFVVLFISLTYAQINIEQALTLVDGSWYAVLYGTVLVFAIFGVIWANSSSDFRRYQSKLSTGTSSMVITAIGIALPTVLLLGYVVALVASKPELAASFASNPITALVEIAPAWSVTVLLSLLAVLFVAGAVITSHSTALAAMSSGAKFSNLGAMLITVLSVTAIALVLLIFVPQLSVLLVDFAIVLAVPVAAWLGMLSADLILRNRGYHAPSLMSRKKLYPDYRFGNILVYVITIALGYGLIIGNSVYTSWLGYIGYLSNSDLLIDLSQNAVGVFVTLFVAFLLSIIFSMNSVLKQEAKHEDLGNDHAEPAHDNAS